MTLLLSMPLSAPHFSSLTPDIAGYWPELLSGPDVLFCGGFLTCIVLPAQMSSQLFEAK